jgi:DNA polymerase-4
MAQRGTFGCLCRDCHAANPPEARRCAACGSPRLLAHPELHALAIAHVDCDAFYASVEKRDNPALLHLPVIIGGGKRGVVSTACYVARIAGVRSAMPMFKALELCPNAVVISPDMEKYAEAGKAVRAMMRELTPLVEPLSIDEAFLDLSGTQRLHKASPAQILLRFAARVESELNLTVSVGLSYCKFLAKVASDRQKPRGFSVIGKAEAVAFLGSEAVSLIWGVGKATQKLLAADGIETIGQIQAMDESVLARRYGSIGLRLSRLSRGIDRRPVDPGGEAKSVSAETTFDEDRSDPAKLAVILRKLAEKVAARLKSQHIAGQTVVLKMKTADFRIRSRNRSLPDPTQLADRIFRVGLEMMKRETDGTKFRLIGIGVAGLVADDRADPEDLVDIDATKRAKAERAMDKVREKFGKKAVGVGMTFRLDSRKTQ